MAKYKKYFITTIKRRFPGHADEIIAGTNDHYKVISVDTAFVASSGNPIDKRLDFCAYFLALIKTLDKRGENFETTRKICLEIVTEYVKPKNQFQQFVKRLPAKLVNTWLATFLLGEFDKRVSKNANPDGFIANIITDKQETLGLGYGIDILECGICKLFKKHNYQKYAAILCEVDALTSDLAGLKLIRTGTIALGAPKCDFRWERKD
ncbi:MAG TPA: L-2-amino-thiazoline-4-carboxylic acid hydrolase [Chitinophagaceae bacterium]|nr:L-2-amino-thiazoline-4-carboxylic acid hydrolase [Chitinophagaceae bacterium]